MKLAQRKIKWLTRLMLSLLLFSQGIVTAYACVSPTAGAVQAYSDNQAYSVSQSNMPCHQQTNPLQANANACLAHCTQSDQASAGQVMLLAVPAATVSLRVIVPAAQYNYQTPYPEYVVANSGPPLSIRFCSFLI